MKKEDYIDKVMCGDCLELLKEYIPDNSIDLIYIDPPFHSGKNYDAIWNNGYEITHFDDTWYLKGKRSGMERYLLWLSRRIRESYRVLKPTGSLYFHCDWHANHHIRKKLDEIFGAKNFRNEIVWCYSGGGGSKKHFGRKHDTIFFYSKSNKYTFNYDDVRVSYTKGGGTWNALQKGRIMKKNIGLTTHNWNPCELGKVVEDYWPIPFINPMAKERLGYPTQKPEALLERIIKASSNNGDTVLDPMCGGGTTLVKAQMLKRNWIGMDVSPTACRMILKRLNDIKVNPLKKKLDVKDVINYPFTEEQLKVISPREFENVC